MALYQDKLALQEYERIYITDPTQKNVMSEGYELCEEIERQILFQKWGGEWKTETIIGWDDTPDQDIEVPDTDLPGMYIPCTEEEAELANIRIMWKVRRHNAPEGNTDGSAQGSACEVDNGEAGS
jgi:hypothetical protein